SLARSMACRSAGIGRLPAWVVRMRSVLCGISSSSMRHETPRPPSRWPKRGEWWDGGRRLPVVGGLFVRIGILNELGLLPGAREDGETRGQTVDIPVWHREPRPLQHAADKGETAAKMRGASMGSRLRVSRELGIAVAVDGGELRPGG